MAKAETYELWALKTIDVICRDKEVSSSTKIEEIKCICRHNGHYPESYKAGDLPEEAWFDELEAIKDSQ